jgi:AraC family transcriptional regulator of adaptative response/methylated-DNA-[protein]-cysteine methyltransferase
MTPIKPPILIQRTNPQPIEELVYGFAQTPFGQAVVARNGAAICALWFCDDDEPTTIKSLQNQFAAISYKRDDKQAEQIVERVIQGGISNLILEVEGSEFRYNIWQRLLYTEKGICLTYGELTERCGLARGAVRAVASAVASNQIGWIIPCHRIVRSRGEIGRFCWGEERKRAMIDWERSSK